MSSAGRGLGSYVVFGGGSSFTTSPYIAIDTLSNAPFTIIRRVDSCRARRELSMSAFKTVNRVSHECAVPQNLYSRWSLGGQRMTMMSFAYSLYLLAIRLIT